MCFHVFSGLQHPCPFIFYYFLGNVFLGVQIINSLGGLRILLIVKCYFKGLFIDDELLINGFQDMSRDGLAALEEKRLQVALTTPHLPKCPIYSLVSKRSGGYSILSTNYRRTITRRHFPLPGTELKTS